MILVQTRVEETVILLAASNVVPKPIKPSTTAKRTMNINAFLDKAHAIHGNKYDYSEVSFQTLSDIITIICPEHGSFQQRVSVHINDQCGCKKCGRKSRPRKTTAEFIAEARI